MTEDCAAARLPRPDGRRSRRFADAVIPELELVICFMGGNCSDPALFIPQRKYVPELILPAVE